jgi:hypothetical protein
MLTPASSVLSIVIDGASRASHERARMADVIDGNRQRLLNHAKGLVTFQELSQHLDAEERDRGLGLPELFDARGATTNLTTGQVRTLVQRAADTLRGTALGPTAIVATDDVTFGMARMYAILTEQAGARVEVFRDIESAKRWLEEVSG